LDDATHSALVKGLNFAISSSILPIEDILRGVEKAVSTLRVENAEEVRYKTVRILKMARKPKNNISRAEKLAHHTLEVMSISPS
jgi:hypothetical protein